MCHTGVCYLSDEALPELQFDEGGAVGGATGDDVVGDGGMISDNQVVKNNPRFDTEWDTFQMSIARYGKHLLSSML